MKGRDVGGSVVRTEAVTSRIRRLDGVSLSTSTDVPSRIFRSFTGPRVAWFSPEEPSLMGCGTAATIESTGPERFADVREQSTALLDAIDIDAPSTAPAAAKPRLVGGFAFHDAFDATPPWRGFGGARFVLPRIQITDTGTSCWVTATGCGPDADSRSLDAAIDDVTAHCHTADSSPDPPPGIVSTERVPDKEEWREQVETALGRIHAGELEKIVLAQRLTARLGGPFRLADALGRLQDVYPTCHRFAIDPGMGAVFVGATPERLVTVTGDSIDTEALAGSIPRGGTAEEDERLARMLVDSPKANREHSLVLEAIRDRVSSIADDVTVGDRTVRRLPNVQHLWTPITARTTTKRHILSIVEALHPTPAVGGLPQETARNIIATTEGFDRGWYAAPVGWFDATGDGTFAVAIRSALASNATATLFAGNGLVADSDPDDEWDELQLKFRPILDQLR